MQFLQNIHLRWSQMPTIGFGSLMKIIWKFHAKTIYFLLLRLDYLESFLQSLLLVYLGRVLDIICSNAFIALQLIWSTLNLFISKVKHLFDILKWSWCRNSHHIFHVLIIIIANIFKRWKIYFWLWEKDNQLLCVSCCYIDDDAGIVLDFLQCAHLLCYKVREAFI